MPQNTSRERILITGGTGFIGTPLTVRLLERWQVRAVSRHPQKAGLDSRVEVLELPPTVEGWAQLLDGCAAVVNLAGESIASGRWTEERKRRIRSSRVEITRALVAGMRARSERPAVFVSASAVGYYGAHGDEALDESSPAGDDFLASVCAEWEREARAAEELGVRVVNPRIGVVLGEGGGALEQMVIPFKLYAGGPVGSGRQWMSWIHRDDVIGMIETALGDGRARGALNATAPEPQPMSELCRTLGAVLGRPSWLPVPGFAVRLALGEMADILLEGQRVLPKAALALGYQFRYPTLAPALRNILVE